MTVLLQKFQRKQEIVSLKRRVDMMKRSMAIMIISLFLVQAFAGLQFVNKRAVEEESTVEVVPAGADAIESEQGARNGGGDQE